MKIDYDGIMIIDHWTTSFGEMTLSNYDSNENADYEPSESEDSVTNKYILISHIRSYSNEILNYRKYMLKKKGQS